MATIFEGNTKYIMLEKLISLEIGSILRKLYLQKAMHLSINQAVLTAATKLLTLLNQPPSPNYAGPK